MIYDRDHRVLQNNKLRAYHIAAQRCRNMRPYTLLISCICNVYGDITPLDNICLLTEYTKIITADQPNAKYGLTIFQKFFRKKTQTVRNVCLRTNFQSKKKFF